MSNWDGTFEHRIQDCPECVGRDGEPKRAYDTEWEAEEVAVDREIRSGVPLSVYPCPHGYGWHLTKG